MEPGGCDRDAATVVSLLPGIDMVYHISTKSDHSAATCCLRKQQKTLGKNALFLVVTDVLGFMFLVNTITDWEDVNELATFSRMSY